MTALEDSAYRQNNESKHKSTENRNDCKKCFEGSTDGRDKHGIKF